MSWLYLPLLLVGGVVRQPLLLSERDPVVDLFSPSEILDFSLRPLQQRLGLGVGAKTVQAVNIFCKDATIKEWAGPSAFSYFGLAALICARSSFRSLVMAERETLRLLFMA
jgi:hypothetical protein